MSNLPPEYTPPQGEPSAPDDTVVSGRGGGSDDGSLAAMHALRTEVAKVVVGQEGTVSGLITALLVRGHVLLEGVPGVAKTLVVKTLAQALALDFARVQFTPDLMPSDVTGQLVLAPDSAGGFRFRQGLCSRTCSLPTRSTAPRPRPRPRSSRRWRNAR
ncbi:MAG: AAA family ATPase [Microthrixaceae bacterium]|nr:AAA family ATPase [Microthrixaceae bacterium]